MALINDDRVKSEPIEEGIIDAINSNMQQLIDEADVFLNRLQDRRNSTTNTSGSTLDSSGSVSSSFGIPNVEGNTASILLRSDESITLTTSFNDTEESRVTIGNIRSNESLNNHQQMDMGGITINEDIITIPLETTTQRLPASPGTGDVNSNNSYDSDDTIIYPHYGPPTITVQSSPIVILDDSFLPTPGQPMSTAIGRRRRNRTCRYSRGLENAATNNSVVDLSNDAETVLILSSDEEDNVRSTRRAAPTASRRTIRFRDRFENNYSAVISVMASGVDEHRDVCVLGHNNRSNRRAAPPTTVARPVAAVVPVAKTPPKVTTTNTTTESPPRSHVICPICYEPLANRPATSTYCGHIFCTECLKQSQKRAKKCPVCKKPLTRPGQIHPVYLTTD